MASGHLSTYLNDHLAGSGVALELLDNLAAVFGESDLGRLAMELRPEVAADREELERLMETLGAPRHATRQAMAWMSEKMTQLKLRVDDPRSGDFRAMESLEALSLGIEGKRSLWIALSAAAANEPALGRMDFDRLIRRAEGQRVRVEEMRVLKARSALGN